MSIKFENLVLPSPEQWLSVVRAVRNSFNSWDLSDSYITHVEDHETAQVADFEFILGENDERLLTTLSSNTKGSERKFLRMVDVTVDISAPLYWWKQFDTYKIGTVCMATSTMHTLSARPLTWEDFSFDIFEESYHTNKTPDECQNLLEAIDEVFDKADDEEFYEPSDALQMSIDMVNGLINYIHKVKSIENPTEEQTLMRKLAERNLFQLLPESFMQKRTIKMNYEVLRSIAKDRAAHKLPEWQEFIGYFKENVKYPQFVYEV